MHLSISAQTPCSSPRLLQCSLSNISNQLVDQLQRLLNSCIRYIFSLKRQEHISPFRKRLHWMRNITRTDYFASLIMYRIVRKKQTPFLTSLFIPYNKDRPSRSLRKDLKIPTASHDWGLQSSQIKCAKFLNIIPPLYNPPIQYLKRILDSIFLHTGREVRKRYARTEPGVLNSVGLHGGKALCRGKMPCPIFTD